jgi:hypothetical protein
MRTPAGPQLNATSGDIRPENLQSTLLTADGVRYLSHGRDASLSTAKFWSPLVAR